MSALLHRRCVSLFSLPGALGYYGKINLKTRRKGNYRSSYLMSRRLICVGVNIGTCNVRAKKPGRRCYWKYYIVITKQAKVPQSSFRAENSASKVFMKNSLFTLERRTEKLSGLCVASHVKGQTNKAVLTVKILQKYETKKLMVT